MEEQKTNATPSKFEVTGSFIGMGMVGFCFGIGVILAVKMVNSLECCIEEVMSRNKVTANKMAEENQVQQETKNQQQEKKNQVQRVTSKGLKKVESDKRLAAHNRKKKSCGAV